jgi:uncharacterized protein (DUF1778 family)
VTATTRLDLRLSARERKRIERAAALAGLPLTTFVRTAALREADRTLAGQPAVHMSPAESKRLVAAISKPFGPNAALQRALNRGEEVNGRTDIQGRERWWQVAPPGRS